MKFGIIGYGNLGKALVRGMVHTGVNQEKIFVNARTEKTRATAKEEYGKINITDNKEELVRMTDVIVLVVEPKNSADVLNDIGKYSIDGKAIISLMAGITRDEISQMLAKQGRTARIVRVMPNIAIANANGILGITYDEADYDEIQEVVQVFDRLGYMLKLDETQLDYVTVTAASGLAFAASLMNAYQEASNILLCNNLQSREITLHIFENVIDMMKSENCSFEDIVKRITTKGGTTEAGMNSLNQDMIMETLKKCVQSSYDKVNRIK